MIIYFMGAFLFVYFLYPERRNNVRNRILNAKKAPPISNTANIDRQLLISSPPKRSTKIVRDINQFALFTSIGMLTFVHYLDELIAWLIPLNKRGMFCNDLSIRFDFRIDTISDQLLNVMVIIVPFLTILLVEFYRHFILNDRPTVIYRLHRWQLHSVIYNTIAYYGIFYFGLCLCDAAKQLGKSTVGALRPHFVSQCRPNMVACIDNPMAYIADINCTNAALNYSRDEIRSSFPSGHAALAFFTALYLVIYLQRRFHHSFSILLRPLIQSLYLMTAVFCALTRVRDHKHHTLDVCAGVLLGTVTALLLTISMWNYIFAIDSDRLGANDIDNANNIIDSNTLRSHHHEEEEAMEEVASSASSDSGVA